MKPNLWSEFLRYEKKIQKSKPTLVKQPKVIKKMAPVVRLFSNYDTSKVA